MYNDWFMKFAPSAYRETRVKTTKDVESTLAKTSNLTDVSAALAGQSKNMPIHARVARISPENR
jgi:type II restriction enzyme